MPGLNGRASTFWKERRPGAGTSWAPPRLSPDIGAEAMSDRATTRFFGLALGLMTVAVLALNALVYN